MKTPIRRSSRKVGLRVRIFLRWNPDPEAPSSERAFGSGPRRRSGFAPVRFRAAGEGSCFRWKRVRQGFRNSPQGDGTGPADSLPRPRSRPEIGEGIGKRRDPPRRFIDPGRRPASRRTWPWRFTGCRRGVTAMGFRPSERKNHTVRPLVFCPRCQKPERGVGSEEPLHSRTRSLNRLHEASGVSFARNVR